MKTKEYEKPVYYFLVLGFILAAGANTFGLYKLAYEQSDTRKMDKTSALLTKVHTVDEKPLQKRTIKKHYYFFDTDGDARTTEYIGIGYGKQVAEPGTAKKIKEWRKAEILLQKELHVSR